MTEDSSQSNAPETGTRRALRQWPVLLGMSAVLAGIFNWFGIPAALLLGPMLAATIFAFRGGRAVPVRGYR